MKAVFNVFFTKILQTNDFHYLKIFEKIRLFSQSLKKIFTSPSRGMGFFEF